MTGTTWARLAALALTAVALTACTHTTASGLPDLPTAPCATEDSVGPCYWDAGTRGDGHGRSFWVDDTGRVFFLAPTLNERKLTTYPTTPVR